jgi:hypothetical protein
VIRVDFSVTLLTVQLYVSVVTQSPTLNGLENKIDREAKTSSNICCKAKATAIHHNHKLAMIGVISTHRLVSISNIPIIQTITFTTIFMIVCVPVSISPFCLNVFSSRYLSSVFATRMICIITAMINIIFII